MAQILRQYGRSSPTANAHTDAHTQTERTTHLPLIEGTNPYGNLQRCHGLFPSMDLQRSQQCCAVEDPWWRFLWRRSSALHACVSTVTTKQFRTVPESHSTLLPFSTHSTPPLSLTHSHTYTLFRMVSVAVVARCSMCVMTSFHCPRWRSTMIITKQHSTKQNKEMYHHMVCVCEGCWCSVSMHQRQPADFRVAAGAPHFSATTYASNACGWENFDLFFCHFSPHFVIYENKTQVHLRTRTHTYTDT